MTHDKPDPKHQLVRGADLPEDATEFYRAMDWLFDAEADNYVATAPGLADAYASGENDDAFLDEYLAYLRTPRKGMVDMTPRLSVEWVDGE